MARAGVATVAFRVEHLARFQNPWVAASQLSREHLSVADSHLHICRHLVANFQAAEHILCRAAGKKHVLTDVDSAVAVGACSTAHLKLQCFAGTYIVAFLKSHRHCDTLTVKTRLVGSAVIFRCID